MRGLKNELTCPGRGGHSPGVTENEKGEATRKVHPEKGWGLRLERQLGGRQANRSEKKANLEFLAIQGFKGVSPTYV